MARRGQRQSGATRTTRRPQRRVRERDNDGIIPVLARAVREVEASVERGSLKQSDRPKFQVVAMLMREERARVKADTEITEPQRAEQLKRLEGIATILAKTAARNTSLLALLAEDAVLSAEARVLKREMLTAAGLEAARGGAAQGGLRLCTGRTPCRPAVGHLPPARQPVPRPRLLQRTAARIAAAPAVHLGAPRPAVPVLRGGGRGRVLLHAPARARVAERARVASS